MVSMCRDATVPTQGNGPDSPLGGEDFEIFSTIKIPPVRRLVSFSTTCSLLLPWRACKSQKQSGKSCGVQTGQAAHLSDTEGAVSELGSHASLPSSACIAFQDWRALANLKPVRAPGGKGSLQRGG